MAAPKAPTLRRNIIFSTLGYVGYGATQWAMLIAVARLQPVHVVGRFSLAFAVTAPVFVLSDMQLRRLAASDVSCRYSFMTYVTLRLICCAVALSIVTLLNSA